MRPAMKTIPLTTLALSLILLGGCAVNESTVSDNSVVTEPDGNTQITSTPTGATVYVDGRRVGTTPMTRASNTLFTPRWKQWTYLVESELVIEKAGCERYSETVHDPLPSTIDATLSCTEKQVNTSQTMQTPDNIEARLRKVKYLRDKKLISASEYSELRQKILDEI